jgi:hypothetical protein
LWWGKANRSPTPTEPLGARQGLREEDEMENGRAVTLVLW